MCRVTVHHILHADACIHTAVFNCRARLMCRCREYLQAALVGPLAPQADGQGRGIEEGVQGEDVTEVRRVRLEHLPTTKKGTYQ